MKRIPVNSTSIAAIGYDPHTCTLEIEFRNSGEVYRYSNVSAEEHVGFIAAPSKGTHLNQVFKPKQHAYAIVSKRQK